MATSKPFSLHLIFPWSDLMFNYWKPTGFHGDILLPQEENHYYSPSPWWLLSLPETYPDATNNWRLSPLVWMGKDAVGEAGGHVPDHLQAIRYSSGVDYDLSV